MRKLNSVMAITVVIIAGGMLYACTSASSEEKKRTDHVASRNGEAGRIPGEQCRLR